MSHKTITQKTVAFGKRHALAGGSGGLSMAVVLWCYQTFAQRSEVTALREQNGKLWHEVHQLETSLAQHQIYIPAD